MNGFADFRTAEQGGLSSDSASASEALDQRTLWEGCEQASRNHDGSASARFTGPQTLGVIHVGFCYRVRSSSSWVTMRMMAGSSSRRPW